MSTGFWSRNHSHLVMDATPQEVFAHPGGAGPDGTCRSEGDAGSAAAARARRGRSSVRLYGGAGGKAAAAACEGR